MNNRIAYLSNVKDYIHFSFNDRIIRFKAPYSLEKIERIIEWNNGYIVLEAKYSHSEELIEDYIDLRPILTDLYIDENYFLSLIENVEVIDAR